MLIQICPEHHDDRWDDPSEVGGVKINGGDVVIFFKRCGGTLTIYTANDPSAYANLIVKRINDALNGAGKAGAA